MVHCPSCGGSVRFDIASQACICDYCQNSFDPQAVSDNPSNDAKTEQAFESYVYICPSCGADLLTNDKRDAIGFCPYCGGDSMIFDRIRVNWQPDSVIPFAVTKEQCKQAYVNEVKRHPFVSRKYCNPELIETFRGIYMPYLSYQAEMKGSFRMVAQTHKTGFLFGGTKTKTYEITGDADTKIEDYTHDASITFDDHLSEKLAPFDTAAKKPFRAGYMSGFYAETGDAKEAEYHTLAKEELRAHSFKLLTQEENVKKQLPMRRLTFLPQESKIPMTIKNCEKVLCPVWFMSYRRKGKITYAAVNGLTGKVGADLPLSPLRIALTALGGAAVLFGILMLLMTWLPTVKAATMLAVCALLTLGGVFLSQHSFIQTISRSLRSDFDVLTSPSNRETKAADLPSASVFAPVRYIGLLMIAVICVIAYFSDGSFKGNYRIGSMILFIITAIPLVQSHFAQGREMKKIHSLNLRTQSLLKNGILIEAKRLLTPLRVINIVSYCLTALLLALALRQVPSKTTYYALCVLLTAALFAVVLLHIWFQVTIAKRRLPQFDKKGARYDEN